MHCLLFLKHFEDRIIWNTAFVRPPALGQGEARASQSWMSQARRKDKPGLGWMPRKTPGVSGVLFLPQLQEKEGRDAPCSRQAQNKRKGGRKCNAFVRSRCSHNRTQLRQNGSDSMFAFIPIQPSRPPRSSCHCSTRSAGLSPLVHTAMGLGASWPHRAHSCRHHVGMSFVVVAMWWGWRGTSSGLLPNSLTVGLFSHRASQNPFSLPNYHSSLKEKWMNQNKIRHGMGRPWREWPQPVMLC